MKTTLKPPGFKRLRLKHGKRLSSFAFKFNLCHYSQGDINIDMSDYDERTALHLAASNGNLKMVKHLVRRCRLPVSKSELKAPMVSALEARIC
jgi:hypothetical protein